MSRSRSDKKMPPAVRRARRSHRASPYPYCRGGRGWLPWCSGGGPGAAAGKGDDNENSMADDALSPVLARLPSAADVVRAAVTCRSWARVVSKDAAVLSSGLPPSLPGLTLGFFYQGSNGASARASTRARSRRPADAPAQEAAHQPCFVPTAVAARLTGLRCPSWTALADAVTVGHGDELLLLEHARPVTARNGWLVLELRQERYTDGVTLCVCNPTRGHMHMVTALAGAESPGRDYACALCTGHDEDPPQPLSAAFFRLVIVYNRPCFTALRSYSSDTGRWSAERRRSGLKMASHEPRELGQGVVVRGVAYWLLRSTAFAVRLDSPEPAEVPMPRTGIRDIPSGWRALGVDATDDGKQQLIFIDAALGTDPYPARARYLGVTKRYVFSPPSSSAAGAGDEEEDGDGGGSIHGKWESTEGQCIRLRQLKVRCEGWHRQVNKIPVFGDTINLRWFCEKSGNLIFTLGQGTGSPGAYLLNMATEHVEKVAEGVDCDLWKHFVGYEMDTAAYLASISRPRPPPQENQIHAIHQFSESN